VTVKSKESWLTCDHEKCFIIKFFKIKAIY
jgi:hypothetical protein